MACWADMPCVCWGEHCESLPGVFLRVVVEELKKSHIKAFKLHLLQDQRELQLFTELLKYTPILMKLSILGLHNVHCILMY